MKEFVVPLMLCAYNVSVDINSFCASFGGTSLCFRIPGKKKNTKFKSNPFMSSLSLGNYIIKVIIYKNIILGLRFYDL